MGWPRSLLLIVFATAMACSAKTRDADDLHAHYWSELTWSVGCQTGKYMALEVPAADLSAACRCMYGVMKDDLNATQFQVLFLTMAGAEPDLIGRATRSLIEKGGGLPKYIKDMQAASERVKSICPAQWGAATRPEPTVKSGPEPRNKRDKLVETKCPPHRKQELGALTEPLKNEPDTKRSERYGWVASLAQVDVFHDTSKDISISFEDALAAFENATYLKRVPYRGDVVIHTTPDGRVFSWYPDRTKIEKARWLICKDSLGIELGGKPRHFTFGKVCFGRLAEQNSAKNPDTDAKWSCMSAGRFNDGIHEAKRGDLFGLAQRDEVPFERPRNHKTSLRELNSN